MASRTSAAESETTTGEACTPLTTLAEFKAAQERRDGYIVVRDRINPNRVHRPECSGLKAEHFVKKVRGSRGRYGDYHFCADYGAALRVARAAWHVRDAGPCLLPSCRSLRDGATT
jgi:hypothetical protein